MKVLVGCEFSGIVREAFKAKGHYALSCDLEPTEIPGLHYQGDIRDIIEDKWDMGIFFPPCNYLCSFSNWNRKLPNYLEKQQQALDFVRYLMSRSIPRIAIENPVGVISTFIRKPDQIIQPFYFGHDESKKTCLWLKNLPPLMTTVYHVYPKEFVVSSERYGHTKQRSQVRSKTFQNIALAMAEQWSF